MVTIIFFCIFLNMLRMYNMSFPEPYNSVLNAQGQTLFALATFQENGTNSLASTLSDSLKSASDIGCDLALQAIRGADIFNQLIVETIQATNSAEVSIAGWMVTYSDQVPSDIIVLEKKIVSATLFVTTINIATLPIEELRIFLNTISNIVIEGNALALKYTGSIFAQIVSAIQLILADLILDENIIINSV